MKLGVIHPASFFLAANNLRKWLALVSILFNHEGTKESFIAPRVLCGERRHLVCL